MPTDQQYIRVDQFMASLGDKEATYNAGPALWTAPAALQLFEFGEDFVVNWADLIAGDRETVHGSQYATLDEIIRQDAGGSYPEPRVRPASLAGWAALAGGAVVSVQDAALAAWRHKLTPVGVSTSTPSIGIQVKRGLEQLRFTGVKADGFTLRRGGPQRAYFELAVPLIGSGTRVTAADAFPAKLTAEDLLRWGDARAFRQYGGALTIAATPVQGAANISGGTVDALATRLMDFSFEWRNDHQAEMGYFPGGARVRSDLFHGPNRNGVLTFTLRKDSAATAGERANYTARDNMAFELNVDSGTIIAATGSFKYGCILIVPRFRLAPLEEGLDNGIETITFRSTELFDDGTNPVWLMYVYTVQSQYLV